MGECGRHERNSCERFPSPFLPCQPPTKPDDAEDTPQLDLSPGLCYCVRTTRRDGVVSQSRPLKLYLDLVSRNARLRTPSPRQTLDRRQVAEHAIDTTKVTTQPRDDGTSSELFQNSLSRTLKSGERIPRLSARKT